MAEKTGLTLPNLQKFIDITYGVPLSIYSQRMNTGDYYGDGQVRKFYTIPLKFFTLYDQFRWIAKSGYDVLTFDRPPSQSPWLNIWQMKSLL